MDAPMKEEHGIIEKLSRIKARQTLDAVTIAEPSKSLIHVSLQRTRAGGGVSALSGSRGRRRDFVRHRRRQHPVDA